MIWGRRPIRSRANLAIENLALRQQGRQGADSGCARGGVAGGARGGPIKSRRRSSSQRRRERLLRTTKIPAKIARSNMPKTLRSQHRIRFIIVPPPPIAAPFL